MCLWFRGIKEMETLKRVFSTTFMIEPKIPCEDSVVSKPVRHTLQMQIDKANSRALSISPL